MIKIECPECNNIIARPKLPKKLKCGKCGQPIRVTYSKTYNGFGIKRINKYNNRICRCKLNHVHQSKAEANYCNKLRLLKQVGEIKDYKSQKSYLLYARNGKKIGTHVTDFEIVNNDNSLEIHEVKSKGTITSLWKLKRALFENNYSDILYKVIWV